MVRINTIEIRVPKKITVPIGAHNGLLLIIIGITPIDAARHVKSMGRILLSPARTQASATVLPCLNLSSSI